MEITFDVHFYQLDDLLKSSWSMRVLVLIAEQTKILILIFHFRRTRKQSKLQTSKSWKSFYVALASPCSVQAQSGQFFVMNISRNSRWIQASHTTCNLWIRLWCQHEYQSWTAIKLQRTQTLIIFWAPPPVVAFSHQELGAEFSLLVIMHHRTQWNAICTVRKRISVDCWPCMWTLIFTGERSRLIWERTRNTLLLLKNKLNHHQCKI